MQTQAHHINRLFNALTILRGNEVKQLEAFAETLLKKGVSNVGPRVFEGYAARRWAVQAYDDVLRDRDEIKDLAALQHLYDGFSRDMIAFTAQYDPTVSEPPAYWRAFGRAHEQMSATLSRMVAEQVAA